MSGHDAPATRKDLEILWATTGEAIANLQADMIDRIADSDKSHRNQMDMGLGILLTAIVIATSIIIAAIKYL